MKLARIVSRGVLPESVARTQLGSPGPVHSAVIDAILEVESFRKHLHAVEVVSGVVLIVIGTLLVTNQFARLAGYLSFLNRFSM